MAVQIVLFILLEHFRDEVVVRGHLEEDVDGVGDEEHDCGGAADGGYAGC